jgi:hypothetical protein
LHLLLEVRRRAIHPDTLGTLGFDLLLGLRNPELRRKPFTSEVRTSQQPRDASYRQNSTELGILNYTNTIPGGWVLHVARRFERLLDAHRRPDGSRWTGQRLDEATGGVVTRSYVTNLRKGRIESPGYEKMLAIARVMGFPPEAWFEDVPGTRAAPAEGQDLAGRVERFFEDVRSPVTGEPYTNAEVARMTMGDLSEEDVEGIRTGSVGDPTVGQVAALASAFGVEPSYLLDRGEAPLDAGLVGSLWDETIREAVREISRLPERERHLVLGIVRQFGSPDEEYRRPVAGIAA